MRLATVAITGGIAEGKSTVLGFLRDAGYRVASSDEIAAQLLTDSRLGQAVAEATGLTFPLDRSELRTRLLRDGSVRRKVNLILHGPIVRALDECGAEFAEVPLLIETCLQDHFAEVWVATCGAEMQYERLMARYGSELQVKAVLATQLDSATKLAFADVVIRTNTGLECVKESTLEAAAERKDVARASK